MPVYEYECQTCKEHFEISQRITASPLTVCPKCNGRMNRLLGKGSGIIFKGSGFYATDYRKGKNPETPACPLKKEGGDCKSCPAKEK